MVNSWYKYAGYYWALTFASVFFYLYLSDYRKIETHQGVVVDVRKGISARPRIEKLFPEFEFSYNDSIYTGTDESRAIRNYKVGERVMVYFPKGKPDKAAVYTFFSFWVLRYDVVLPIIIAFFIFLLPLLIQRLISDIRSH